MKLSISPSVVLIALSLIAALYLARPVVGAVNTAGTAYKAPLDIPHADSPLSGVTLEGPAMGVVGVTYTFTATVSPAEATQPVTYLWEVSGQTDIEQAGGLSTVASFTWSEAGSYTLTVTAENGAGAAVQTSRPFLIQQPPLDIVMVLDKSGSMNYETSCFGCWTPYPSNHPSYDVIANPYPLNGVFNPLARVDNTNLCTEAPVFITDTQSKRYLVHEAEYYSKEGPLLQGWTFDQRLPGRGYWALQKTGIGSNAAYIRAHPLVVYSQSSLSDFPQLQGAAYNEECFSTGICWKERAEQLGESTPTQEEVPYIEYDFSPQWVGSTHIWIRAVGGNRHSFEWFGQSPAEVPGGALLPWQKAIYWQVTGESFSSTVSGGPFVWVNSYGSSEDYDGVERNDDWRWIKLGSILLTEGQQATLRLYQGSAGFNVDKILFTDNSGGNVGSAVPNTGNVIPTYPLPNSEYSALKVMLQQNGGRGPNTTAGSATREACNLCNPAYGQTVTPAQCTCKASHDDSDGGTGLGCTTVSATTDQLYNDLFSDIQPLRAEKQAVLQLTRLLQPRFDQLGFVMFHTFVDNAQREKLQCLRYAGQLPEKDERYCYGSATTPLSYTNIIRASEAATNIGGTNIAQGLIEGLEELGVNTPYNSGVTSDCNLGSGYAYGLNRGSNNKRPCDRRGAAGRVLILMTDGSPNEPDPGDFAPYCPNSLPASATWQGAGGSTLAHNCSIYYAQQAAANHVALYTIGIGAGSNPALLEAMATGVDSSTGHVYFEGGCGRFFDATDWTELVEIIPEIVASARSCVPSLSLAKSGPAVVLAGEPITYTLTLTNTGALPLTGLVITDAIPAGATYLGGGTNTEGVVSWTLDHLAVGETAQVTFTVTATTSITNSDYRASGEGVNVKGFPPVFTEIIPVPKLEISKLGPTSALVGQPITYTLIVTNSGTLTATNLVITDVIPAGASYLGGNVQAGEVVSWTLGSLGIGEASQFTFAVTASQAITNSDYGVSAEGGFTATGHSAVSTHVSPAPEPVLTLSKKGPATAIAGQLITYTLTVTNSGLTTATNLVITDALPAGANYIRGGVKGGNVISWTLGSLGLEATAQVTFVVTATQAITNSSYGVRADGGYQAKGLTPVVTIIEAREEAQETLYLPLIVKQR